MLHSWEARNYGGSAACVLHIFCNVTFKIALQLDKLSWVKPLWAKMRLFTLFFWRLEIIQSWLMYIFAVH